MQKLLKAVVSAIQSTITNNDFFADFEAELSCEAMKSLVLCSGSSKPDGVISCVNPLNAVEKVTLLVAEAKSVESGSMDCFAQLMSVSSGACTQLRILGAREEDCVVPCLAFSGYSFQVFATFLVDGVPQMAQMSDCIQLGQHADSQSGKGGGYFAKAKHWLVHLARFVEASKSLFENAKTDKADGADGTDTYFLKPIERSYHRSNGMCSMSSFESRSRSKSTTPEPSVGSGNFSNGTQRSISSKSKQRSRLTATTKISRQYFLLNYVLHLYHLLYSKAIAESKEREVLSLFLFPVGVFSIPYRWEVMFSSSSGTDEEKTWNNYRKELIGKLDKRFQEEIRGRAGDSTSTDVLAEGIFDGLSLLVYPRLVVQCGDANSFSTDLPKDEDIRQLYLTNLKRAVKWLDRSGVVHGDLRPSNILWRKRGGGGDETEMVIIDFEMACEVGHTVDRCIWKGLDGRFPWHEENQKRLLGIGAGEVESVVAELRDNSWFVVAMEHYFLHGGRSSYDDFTRKQASIIAEAFIEREVDVEVERLTEQLENVSV